MFPPETNAKRAVRMLVAVSMVIVGVVHFASPAGFVRIVPSFLPAPLLLVYISGVAEIAGGIGILSRRFHRLAAFGLIALFIAVFPANINMAANDIQPSGSHMPAAALWLRLPFQGLFIAIAWWLSRSPVAGRPPPPVVPAA